jgi:PAS domain S-box-containing protein
VPDQACLRRVADAIAWPRSGHAKKALNNELNCADYLRVTMGESRGLASSGVSAPALRARPWNVLLPVIALGVGICAVEPEASTQLHAQTTFIPIMLALVGCFSVLSIVLLVGQFRDTGGPRALALAAAYVFSLMTLLGWAAAFPGVFGRIGTIGAVPSTAPWLWVIWHTGFPVLLAVALLPLPRTLSSCVVPRRRTPLAWATVLGTVAGSSLLVAGVVVHAARLPVVIHGVDTSEMTRIAGPVMLPVVFLATVLTVLGACRRSGPERWAGLAAAASLGDVVLTLFSHYRFSLGWYTGRTLTIVASGVVLVAFLAEFRSIKRRLADESIRLRIQLERTAELEKLQHTLLGNMADGVMMQGRGGELLASNPAAHQLSGLSIEQMTGRAPVDPGWATLRADGSPYETCETPPMVTLRTGVGRQEVLGVRSGDGSVSWMSVHTAPVMDPSGSVDFVVTSMTDVTEQHAGRRALELAQQQQAERIGQVLDDGGPVILFQPILELASGKPVGAEALARFTGEPYRPPNEWFTDAASVGLGVELELSAMRAALSALDQLPAGTYLSLNAAPSTVTSPALREMLRGGVVAGRVVLELTEHVGVADYTELGRALDGLRAMGVRLAVDDAGSGFSSLQHILNLRPDIIKLDRALVEGIDNDPARRALAGALLTFAAEIGAQVVAEGIENQREQTVLRRLGVRYGQGFHLGRPAPLPLTEDAPSAASRLFVVNGR